MNNDYGPVLTEALETLYEMAMSGDQWKLVKDDTKHMIKYFKPSNGAENLLCSKSIIEVHASSDVIVKTFTNFERAKEFDSYFDSAKTIKTLVEGSKPWQLSIHSESIPVLVERCDIVHTKYMGYWPVFSPRDAVHLLAHGTFPLKDSSDSALTATFLCIVSLRDELSLKIVPVPRGYIRMNLKAGGGICIPKNENVTTLVQTNCTDLKGWVPKQMLDVVSSYDSQILFKKICEKRKLEYAGNTSKSAVVQWA